MVADIGDLWWVVQRQRTDLHHKIRGVLFSLSLSCDHVVSSVSDPSTRMRSSVYHSAK